MCGPDAGIKYPITAKGAAGSVVPLCHAVPVNEKSVPKCLGFDSASPPAGPGTGG